MPWTNAQKGRVKRYQRWAEIPDTEYRALLYEITGAMSSKHPGLTQWHFDVTMPTLEARLEEHLARTGKPWPKGVKPRYWRTRCPRDGRMTSRQRWKILDDLWPKLAPYVRLAEWEGWRPDRSSDANVLDYLRHMAAFACRGRVADFWGMYAWQADRLIEALKDRLRHALRHAS